MLCVGTVPAVVLAQGVKNFKQRQFQTDANLPCTCSRPCVAPCTAVPPRFGRIRRNTSDDSSGQR
eukprot:3579349-Amphidinium_carterae.1